MKAEDRQPRDHFLTDSTTCRDIFGICRGRCTECDQCGKYLKVTAEYTVQAGESRRHPDNDAGITRCSRCGCPPEAHETVPHEQAREEGNDAFALGQYDAAVKHYSRAIDLLSPAADAALWSNRAAAFLAKGWPQQALPDAERALALRPEWGKAWGRKAAALLQMGRLSEAVEAYQRGLQLGGASTSMQQGLAQATEALRKQQRRHRQAAQPQAQAPQQQEQKQRPAAEQRRQQQQKQQQQKQQPAAEQRQQHRHSKQQQQPQQQQQQRAPASTEQQQQQRLSAEQHQSLQQQSGTKQRLQHTKQQQQQQQPPVVSPPPSLPVPAASAQSPGAAHSSPPAAQPSKLIPHVQAARRPAVVHALHAVHAVPGLLPAWREVQQLAAASQAVACDLQLAVQRFEALLVQAGVLSGQQQVPKGQGFGQEMGRQAEGGAQGEPPAQPQQTQPQPMGGFCQDDASPLDGAAASQANVAALDRANGGASDSGASAGGLDSGADASSAHSSGSKGSSCSSKEASASGTVNGGGGSSSGSTSGGSTSGGNTSGTSIASSDDSDVEEVYTEVPGATPQPPASGAPHAASTSASVGTAFGAGGRGGAASQAAEHSSPKPTMRTKIPALVETARSFYKGRASRAGSSSSSSSGSSGSGSSGGSGSDSDGSHAEHAGPGSRTTSDWLEAVASARRQLGAGGGRVAPPGKSGRRPPKSAHAGSGPARAAGSGAGSLGLGSLQQLCAAVEAATLSKDAAGVARAACKRCGPAACPRYRPSAPGVIDAASVQALMHAQQSGQAANLSVGALCSACLCPSSEHETSKEAATREVHLRRQQMRQQRQQRQPSVGSASAASAAASSMQGGEAEGDRQRRVAAAGVRRQEARAAGDVVQETDCDTLLQQRRTTCTGCTACSGFKIVFSHCGCRADQHVVDAAWQAAEERRKGAQAAAAQRRHSASASAGAGLAARKEEEEAYATLGLPLGADAKTVGRAYKRLALQLHPDKQQQQQQQQRAASAAGGVATSVGEVEAAAGAAQERFLRVAAAYQLLSGRRA